MRTGEACNRTVIVTDPNTGVVQAAQLMREHHVGTVVVVQRDDGLSRPIGIVTDRDIVIEVVAKEVPVKSLAVKDIMTRKLITANEGEDVLDTLGRMRQYSVRRMPVIDARGALVGLLALDDATELLVEQLSQVPQLIRRQQNAEVQERP